MYLCFNCVLPHHILLFLQIQVGVVQINQFDCAFIVFHFIYAIARCYQECKLIPLDKISTSANPFFDYNEAITMIDIRFQTMFLTMSLQFGTSPINSSFSVHSADSDNNHMGNKPLKIRDITIQFPEVFSLKICWSEINDVYLLKVPYIH